MNVAISRISIAVINTQLKGDYMCKKRNINISTNEWETHYRSGIVVKEGFVCSCCDMWNARKTPYCPYCGAKMEDYYEV